MHPYYLRKCYTFDSHSRDSKGNMTQNGTSVLMEFNNPKSIRYYIYSTYSSTFFQALYIKTTVEKFNITIDLISKTV